MKNIYITKQLVHGLCFWMLCFASGLIFAADIPFGQRTVTLSVREQSIGAFLGDFFGQVDIPVVISANVKGAVNGNFSGPAETEFRKILRSFGLVSYYDGAVVHIYTANEITSRTFNLPSAATSKVLRDAQELKLTDTRNSLRTTKDGALVAIGTKRFVDQIEELGRVQQSGSGGPLAFKTFYLRYAWAHDVTLNYSGRQVVLPGVASILRSLMTAPQRGQNYLSTQEQLLRPSQPKLTGQGLARIGTQQGTLGANDVDLRQGDPLVAAYNNYTQAGGQQQNMVNPNLTVIGDGQRIRIEADQRVNAVIVRDSPDRMAQYEELITSLDLEPQSIEIEATIIDINTEKLRDYGVNWRWNNARNSILFGRGDSSDLNLRPNVDITPQGRGSFLNLVLGNASQFVARINALQQQGIARVVSSPQVMTLSNVEAVFDNNKTFYVRVEGREVVDLFNVSAGTSLRVMPHVFKDKDQVRIKLLVAIDDGTLSNAQVDRIPIVERSSINTQALIFEGESLLLGGMVRENKSNQVSKIPLLGDIPFLGNFFKNTIEIADRTERLFLISPRLPPARIARTENTQPPISETSPSAAAQEATKALEQERKERKYAPSRRLEE
jgi:type III secretion protein C